MSKKFIGIDIGNRMLKLVSVSGEKLNKSVVVDLPDNLVRDGRVVSMDTLADLIRNTLKKNSMRSRNAALVLEGENIYVKLVTVPLMSESQIVYNLPFEFKDYITEELNRYIFDYIVLGSREVESEDAMTDSLLPEADEEKETVQVLDLLAVAAPKEILAEMKELLKKAGLKLVKAAPVECALSALIRKSGCVDEDEELCFVDIGQESIRMHVFKGENYVVSRGLTTGLSAVEARLSESYNKDIHVAHTYLMTNFENCQSSQACRDVFSNIAVELQRAVNFYKFSNPDSNLNKIIICGGGGAIAALREEIASSLGMEMFDISHLLMENTEQAYLYPGAYGIALE